MTSPEVKQLIQFLQDNGRSVVSGHMKFSVTPRILRELNKILRSVREDIYVSPLTTANLVEKYSSSNELMFLYDFVKKMPKLKISDTSSSHNFTIDVSDFTNLKYLELSKFNVKHVRGIQFLRENLEIVVCTRCLDKIGDLLLNSDADNSVSSIWSKLQHAVFSCNNLSTIDQSFIYTPWLQYLDISFNNLTDIRPLTCLSNLTHLNVSYNRLTSVPEISMCKLEVLLLNRNYIADISGLSKMENLRELDISENSILEHTNLLPLADLPYLASLKVSKNPISYHPMHRSLTCGYLHENVGKDCRDTTTPFLLDGTPLNSSEREFIRYTSPSINNPAFDALRNTKSNTIVKRRRSKRTRDAFIVEVDYDQNGIVDIPPTSTPIKAEESEDEEKYNEMKKKMEECRNEYGEEYWLLRQKSKFPGFLDFPSPANSPPKNSYIVTEDSNVDVDDSTGLLERKNEEDITKTFHDDASDVENSESNAHVPSYISESDEDDDDVDEEEREDLTQKSLWLVQKVDTDGKQDLFLVLNDEELKEIHVITTKVITRWSLDCIERCIKISNDPLMIKLTFEVARRNDRTRKYIMEFADAQKLMSRVQQELDERPITSFNQKVFRCIKCNAVFCQEIQRRQIDNNIRYNCPVCESTYVVEEEESTVLSAKTSADDKDSIMSNKVKQSPSLSSIGSAASLDQNSEITNSNEDSPNNHQESDIEIISNPSQSSIEILEIHSSRSHDSTITVLPKITDRLGSTEMPSNSASKAANQLLTESSSSGSMTDSICTSYETNPYTRGPHRISQSTVDEVLQEESSCETSPQQRRSEEKTITENDKLKNEKNTGNESINFLNYSAVFEALKEKCQLSSSPRKSIPALDDLVSTYEYSYSNFTNIDHRIKYYIWDQLTPNSVEITAFLRVDKLCKCGSSYQPFPALLVLTEKKLYFVKITKEEKDDPMNWLQKNDTIGVDKIKLIQPILWKQGFSIEVEDRAISSSAVRYVCFLYDEKRTDDFLSHVRDLGSIHVQKSEEQTEESDLKNILQLEEHVRNFVMTDMITIRKDEDTKRLPFVGMVVTNSDFIIVKGDADWLLPNATEKPTITLKESIGNLMKVVEAENTLTLLFLKENEQAEQSWEIKIVTPESKNKIIYTIRQPWEEIYSVQLEVTYAAD